jgi:glycosyltransferase involved in cell wall biosynthesis
MNVGFFCPTLNSIGGGELVALNMIRALEKRNHKVIVYTAKKIDQVNIQNFLGERIHFDKEVTIRPNFSDPYSLQSIYPNLLKSFFFKFKCDLLIDTFSDAIYPWADAVYFQKDARITRLPKGFKGLLFVPYKTFLRNGSGISNHREKILMSCSEYAAKKIGASTGRSVNVLYPPLSNFFKTDDFTLTRNKRVVTVTRISNDKRPETIPQIAQLLPDNLSFVIVGSCRLPSEIAALKRLQEFIHKFGVGKKVELLINVSREKQREVLQSARIYLHPFVPFEAFGISVVEAMSAGCVPIVPDIGGLKEIVPSQLRYSSLSEAASLVTRFIDNWSPSKAQESARAVDKFSQARFCEKFLRLMRL